jgi:hypothetical protein
MSDKAMALNVSNRQFLIVGTTAVHARNFAKADGRADARGITTVSVEERGVIQMILDAVSGCSPMKKRSENQCGSVVFGCDRRLTPKTFPHVTNAVESTSLHLSHFRDAWVLGSIRTIRRAERKATGVRRFVSLPSPDRTSPI